MYRLKYFLLILLLLFISPVFASNLLQQEFETKVAIEFNNNSKLVNMSKNALFINDYQGYLNGQDSVYGALLNLRDLYKNKPDSNLNKRYISLMLNQYNVKIKSINNSLFNIHKIIIDDNDYNKLDKEVKGLLAGFNIFLAEQ